MQGRRRYTETLRNRELIQAAQGIAAEAGLGASTRG